MHVTDRRVWRKYVQDPKKGVLQPELKQRNYCGHDVGNRDFFSIVRHHSFGQTKDRTLEGAQCEAADSVLNFDKEPVNWEWMSN